MAPEIHEIRDRVLRLELGLEQAIRNQVEIKAKVDEMHDLLLRARGAKWAALMLVTALAGVAGYLANVLQTWLNPPPH